MCHFAGCGQVLYCFGVVRNPKSFGQSEMISYQNKVRYGNSYQQAI